VVISYNLFNVLMQHILIKLGSNIHNKITDAHPWLSRCFYLQTRHSTVYTIVNNIAAEVVLKIGNRCSCDIVT